MTVHDFNNLSDDVHQAVQLYQVPAGFFVELNYDVEKNEIEFCFAFDRRL